MPNNFIKDIIKNANEQIKYKNTVTTGEITVDNGDGTYDVKIANASSAYPNVETINYDAVFSVGEIVDIIFEHGCKEAPKIIGHSKKIKQEPKQVEVDYSGGCAGMQTITTTIYATAESGAIWFRDQIYDNCHNTSDGSGINYIEIFLSPLYIMIGQNFYEADYSISRGFLYFDTSSLPANAIITNALLSINIIDNYDIDFNIVIQDGQPNYPHSSIVNSDVNYLNYHNNGGQMAAVTAEDPPVYSNIILNSNGINWINKGGITKLCLRSSQDIASISPVGEDFTEIMIDNETNLPKLTITYTI